MTANTYKLVMLGGGAVGKSAITVQLVSGHFVQIYDPTIEDSYRTSISVDGEMVSLDILDTAGQEEYSALRDQYMRSGDGYVIVYSITSTTSFLEANGFREQLYRVLDKDVSEHVSIALCGNKCDLESERQVQTNEAKNLAEQWKVLFFETSAKAKINITETFQALVKDIKANRAATEPSATTAEANDSKGKKDKKEKKEKKCIMF
ncbi:Ras family GTPase [Entamoeba histolytica HM-1:IMSS-B]|uniref:small monomeric GTPase n=6 Tax=Entamoeba histolytica TaxID=5759 RepID=A0A8U0WNZ9_ENTH1|nr:Ras family GTPase [Entamoeba histolytica HM-1:IMSS]AAA21446.1 ras homologue 1 [Entamoeba histolytica]EMD45027.1 ras 1 family protein [Entamoeba histolytica KU27]EMH76479.1 Ras family GTPase [Entamoeba histolytica HM-1:IMSS-B]EMS13961.1 ras 1 family protein [Entamoeba histolytica HM-3:IMSS]ENY60831.1 ras 1 family protein, putative [Entamoeba histolytica HM-1:IMSS-A]|eukprot:XP_654039.1 Ras family GTPase [Entamoeba histolytica HM-1:IMSS]